MSAAKCARHMSSLLLSLFSVHSSSIRLSSWTMLLLACVGSAREIESNKAAFLLDRIIRFCRRPAWWIHSPASTSDCTFVLCSMQTDGFFHHVRLELDDDGQMCRPVSFSCARAPVCHSQASEWMLIRSLCEFAYVCMHTPIGNQQPAPGEPEGEATKGKTGREPLASRRLLLHEDRNQMSGDSI